MAVNVLTIQEELCSSELRMMYLSVLRTHNIVSVLTSAGLEWAERVARVAKTRNADRILARMLNRENRNEDRRLVV